LLIKTIDPLEVMTNTKHKGSLNDFHIRFNTRYETVSTVAGFILGFTVIIQGEDAGHASGILNDSGVIANKTLGSWISAATC